MRPGHALLGLVGATFILLFVAAVDQSRRRQAGRLDMSVHFHGTIATMTPERDPNEIKLYDENGAIAGTISISSSAGVAFEGRVDDSALALFRQMYKLEGPPACEEARKIEQVRDAEKVQSIFDELSNCRAELYDARRACGTVPYRHAPTLRAAR